MASEAKKPTGKYDLTFNLEAKADSADAIRELVKRYVAEKAATIEDKSEWDQVQNGYDEIMNASDEVLLSSFPREGELRRSIISERQIDRCLSLGLSTEDIGEALARTRRTKTKAAGGSTPEERIQLRDAANRAGLGSNANPVKSLTMRINRLNKKIEDGDVDGPRINTPGRTISVSDFERLFPPSKAE